MLGLIIEFIRYINYCFLHSSSALTFKKKYVDLLLHLHYTIKQLSNYSLGEAMSITTITSREFNQDVSKAKRIATSGPVFITDRGHLAHVLLTANEYQKLTNTKETIVDLLAMPDAATIDFEIPKISNEIYHPEVFE